MKREMNRLARARSIVAATAAVIVLAGFASAQETKDYSQTIADFSTVASVAAYFDSAYGYAVFPTIGKGGLVIGAAHGKGQVYRGGEVTGFTSLTQVTIGFQLGGQAYSQVIFFQDQRAYEEFTSGSFEFTAEASAIAVTAAASARASTEGTGAGANAGSSAAQADPGYHKGMIVFTMGKGGLMYQAAIGGQGYNFDPLR